MVGSGGAVDTCTVVGTTVDGIAEAGGVTLTKLGSEVTFGSVTITVKGYHSIILQVSIIINVSQ